jgi:NAD(P)-dependent dehydrogenase (short-subunit alcohol dehydrogenase family)
MARLSGSVALITGGTDGIGRCACELFAREGASVAVAGRSADKGREVVDAIRKAGGEALFLPTDVADAANVANTVAETVKAFGKLTVLYNNAGGSSPRDGSITEVSVEEIQRSISVDLLGTIWCCRFAIPEIVRAGGGSVINTASVGAIVGLRDLAAYTAAKGGVVALTRSMAVDYAAKKVRVNVIAPSTIRTPRVDNLLRQKPHLETLLNQTLLGIGEPIDVANTALHLASAESRLTTGHVIFVDSGVTIT